MYIRSWIVGESARVFRIFGSCPLNGSKPSAVCVGLTYKVFGSDIRTTHRLRSALTRKKLFGTFIVLAKTFLFHLRTEEVVCSTMVPK